MSAADILRDIPTQDDMQEVVESLHNEYLRLSEGELVGLHRVRSEHLVRILNLDKSSSTVTALRVIDSIPSHNLSSSIANALQNTEIDPDHFLNGLIDKAKQLSIQNILQYTDGIFEAGERIYCQSNESVLNEAYELVGTGYTLFAGQALSPTRDSSFLDSMINSMGDAMPDLVKLKVTLEKAVIVPRGHDMCKFFLRVVAPAISADAFLENIGATGIFLDWCATCNVTIPQWPAVKSQILEREQHV